MKVLHVITGLGAGGAEQQLRLLLRHLPPEYQCDVVALTNPGIVAAGLRADGVRVGDLAMRGNRDLAALPRLARLIRREGYDVVHCHLYRASVYGRIAARLAGVRAIVTTEHSLLAQTIEGRRITFGVRALYLATERLGRCTVAVSRAVAERLADWGVPEHRVRVIPNGVGAARYRQPAPVRAATRQAVRAALGLPQDAFVFGGVGRLVPGKRFDILVDALALLPRTEGAPEVRLLLVGDGGERAALEQRARAAGVADRVVFAGERDDVPELLTAMDVLAAPSTVETFGLALLEALAAGLPVRWSSGPALAELPEGAAPGARRTLARPSAYAAELQALRTGGPRRAGAPAQPEAVRHYDMARLALAVAELYQQVADHPAAPRPDTAETPTPPEPAPPKPTPPKPSPPKPSPPKPAPPRPSPRPIVSVPEETHGDH
ncbi:glycosyltransferase [Streptacidiphilus sp. P02-A3a]|uniref:glycosyltransferase n=1 Tax=Streptacidiphilus sp. P02-A3a TaxID=2704468 RepID=UPI0015FC0C37|nr:glycosyltransferase [Streptacidiphilus sp. P02-A3a]QMU71939.1 glycosyltransferase [Streptacidiphilus sp. P02-A3a]